MRLNIFFVQIFRGKISAKLDWINEFLCKHFLILNSEHIFFQTKQTVSSKTITNFLTIQNHSCFIFNNDFCIYCKCLEHSEFLLFG